MNIENLSWGSWSPLDLSDPFKPFEDKAYTMGYYEVPIDILEDQELIIQWVDKSVNVARKKQTKRKIPGKKKKLKN